MKRLVALAVVISFLATTAPATEDVSVKTLGANHFSIELNTPVDAAPARVWSVLTDYDHHAGFLPYMTKSRIREQTSEFKIVQQEGKIRILFWTFAMHVTQRVTETAPERMSFHAIEGDFRVLDGTWTLEALTPTATALGCKFTLEPKRQVPEWAVRMAAKRYLSVMVKRLRVRAEQL